MKQNTMMELKVPFTNKDSSQGGSVSESWEYLEVMCYSPPLLPVSSVCHLCQWKRQRVSPVAREWHLKRGVSAEVCMTKLAGWIWLTNWRPDIFWTSHFLIPLILNFNKEQLKSWIYMLYIFPFANGPPVGSTWKLTSLSLGGYIRSGLWGSGRDK